MVYVLTREARGGVRADTAERDDAGGFRGGDRLHADQPHLLETFAEVLATVGTPRLYKHLLDALQDLATVDDLTILTLEPDQPLQLVGLASRCNAGVLRSLTRDYVAQHHSQDPNFSELSQPTRSRRVLVRRHDFNRLKTKAYQIRFYTSVGVVDKLSYIWRSGRTAYYVNLYRNVSSGLYTTAEVQALTSIARFLANLVHLHSARLAVGEAMRHNEGDDLAERLVTLLDPRLTVRETMVLSRILKGLQTEGIALDLNVKPASVVTFKQRAFGKLGITTQAELFARCITALPMLTGAGAGASRPI